MTGKHEIQGQAQPQTRPAAPFFYFSFYYFYTGCPSVAGGVTL